MQIQQRPSKFPVPAFRWYEYCLDQEINDRGIRVDTPFVKQALRLDALSNEKLSALMKEITKLNNPNSVQQMKEWLAENGMETDSLGKKEVSELLKTAPPKLAEVLTLRRQLAKSSVKKYTVMKAAVCSDTYCFNLSGSIFLNLVLEGEGSKLSVNLYCLFHLLRVLVVTPNISAALRNV